MHSRGAGRSAAPAGWSWAKPGILALPEFGPYQSQVVRLSWSSVTAAEDAGASAPAYPLEEFPSAELQALAGSFSRYPHAERAQRIYQWMIDNVAFSGLRRGVDGAEHALSQRQGDCTAHMLLAAELLSRNGISVRRALGGGHPRRSESNKCWRFA